MTTRVDERTSTRATATTPVDASRRSDDDDVRFVAWDDVDPRRFYAIGTVAYSGLTALLHPVTVVKTRWQVLGERGAGSSYAPRLLLRGLPVVVSVAVPARVLYVTVLEETRSRVHRRLVSLGLSDADAAAVGGGLAGGVAGLVAQTLVVPADVVSQRQMVSSSSATKGPSARAVVTAIASESSLRRGLYRGFGVSALTSLPAGTVWWAIYGSVRERLTTTPSADLDPRLRAAAAHVVASTSAAAVTVCATQPLDVVRTRLQVASSGGATETPSVRSVARRLYETSGVRGFWRGTGPRMLHMGLWGTVLVSAFEWLKYVSRNDAYRERERERDAVVRHGTS